MKHTEIAFLTSNHKKAQDFSSHGFAVNAFDEEILEVLSPEVEVVVLHKASCVNMTNFIVEDTALSVSGADFLGTEIKHVYDEIKLDDSFNGKVALWEVSLCMKKEDTYYIATGATEGILKYPVAPKGYHFDKIFAVKKDNEHIHFELLSDEEKISKGPRFKAIRKLLHALDTNDYSALSIVKEVPVWTGEYQVETTKNKKSLKP